MELTEWKEKALDTINGELTFKKLDFCLIGVICFLAGVCIGMIAAPLTHGISIAIGSHNGSNNTGNGCHNGSENGNSDSHNA